MSSPLFFFFFFFNDTATTEIYTLSLHDALPIWAAKMSKSRSLFWALKKPISHEPPINIAACSLMNCRSEEHTSELQSLAYLVCRLLLEKKKKNENHIYPS